MGALDLDYMLGLVPMLLGYLPRDAGAWRRAAMALALVLAVAPRPHPGRCGCRCSTRWRRVFISFFRGTPLLVQLFLFYYGLPQVIPALTVINGVTAAMMGLTLHFSAYMAESIRAAILGVDRSQWEASRAVGMTEAADACAGSSCRRRRGSRRRRWSTTSSTSSRAPRWPSPWASPR